MNYYNFIHELNSRNVQFVNDIINEFSKALGQSLIRYKMIFFHWKSLSHLVSFCHSVLQSYDLIKTYYTFDMIFFLLLKFSNFFHGIRKQKWFGKLFTIVYITNYGRPMKPFSLKSRTFGLGQINSGAFGVFSAKLSVLYPF